MKTYTNDHQKKENGIQIINAKEYICNHCVWI